MYICQLVYFTRTFYCLFYFLYHCSSYSLFNSVACTRLLRAFLIITQYSIRNPVGCSLLIQHNNTESMLSPANDRWPRTMLVCVRVYADENKKKSSLSLCLKTRVSVIILRSVGSCFQTRGPATENARSPSLSLVDCLSRSLLLAEWFEARPGTYAVDCHQPRHLIGLMVITATSSA